MISVYVKCDWKQDQKPGETSDINTGNGTDPLAKKNHLQQQADTNYHIRNMKTSWIMLGAYIKSKQGAWTEDALIFSYSLYSIANDFLIYKFVISIWRYYTNPS